MSRQKADAALVKLSALAENRPSKDRGEEQFAAVHAVEQYIAELETRLATVAAETREACAKLVEAFDGACGYWPDCGPECSNCASIGNGVEQLAVAIRAMK